MSRGSGAGVLAEVAAGVVRPFVAAELDFPDGTIRLNSTDRALSFAPGGGSPEEAFLGVGRLGAMAALGETAASQASGVEMTLSGIPAEFLSVAFEKAQGRAGKIWIGFLDADYRVVADPVLVFQGLIDTTRIHLGETASVTVTVESRLIEWRRPRTRRWNNADQQSAFPGDLGFEFVEEMVDKEIQWGVPTPAAAQPSQPLAPRAAGLVAGSSFTGGATDAQLAALAAQEGRDAPPPPIPGAPPIRVRPDK